MGPDDDPERQLQAADDGACRRGRSRRRDPFRFRCSVGGDGPLPLALRVTAADVVGHLARGGGALAEADGQAAGAVLWAQRDGGLYVSRLAIVPASRRQGIAMTLMAAAEAAARGMGVPCMRLSTRLVLVDNRRLFAACGFVKTTRETHPGYREPTFVNMEKRLIR